MYSTEHLCCATSQDKIYSNPCVLAPWSPVLWPWHTALPCTGLIHSTPHVLHQAILPPLTCATGTIAASTGSFTDAANHSILSSAESALLSQLCCTVLHCTAMYCTTLCHPSLTCATGTIAASWFMQHFYTSYCTQLYCHVLYCTVLYRTAQNHTVLSWTTSLLLDTCTRPLSPVPRAP